ncbi:MAG: alpha/beta fold hydrolase [Acidobacteriia bacterium]|nr:alpha/beta fold hydrolase [Terriglobia bacterium]
MRKAALIIAIIAAVPVLGVVAVAGRALGVRASLRQAAAADEKHSIVVGGLTHHYLLHVPTDLPSKGPVPLVLIFHGGGGNAWNMPGLTHFDELADDQGFLVAYPDSFNKNWNDTRGLSSADDVGFIRALIDEVSRSRPVDPHRVYATGISNGSFFSNRLACDLTDKIAAIASVAATMPESLVPPCKPSRPISVLYMHGTEDPLVPIGGGRIGFRHGRARGDNTSLADAAKFWRTQDRISSPPVRTELPDRVNDGTHVHRDLWTGGADDTEVVVYTIEGGGHAWPSGPQYLPPLIVGKASRNLNATRVIWEFFQTQSLP